MANLHVLKPLPHQTDGITLGENSTDKAGFHGAACIKRAGAAQVAIATAAPAAVAATPASTGGGQYGYTQAQANALVDTVNKLVTDNTALIALVNELRAALVEKGAIKGAA